MNNKRKQLIDWYSQSQIEKGDIDTALLVADVRPTHAVWLRLIDRLMLWGGLMALSVATMFFVAYNWYEMNHIGHFVLVQTFLVTAIAGYWKWHRHPYLAPSLLVTASLLLGALLALVGQTYQTGANSWQLFFTWACLLIPWVIAAKSNAMWLLFLSLLNLSLYLWHVVNPGWPQDLWTNERSLMIWGMLFNAVAVAVWEAAASLSNSASSRWPMRLLGTLSALCAFWIAAQMIVEETLLVIPLSLVTFWLASAFCFYRYLRLDMYFLSILAMWGTAIVGAATIYWSLDNFNLGGLLFSTMVILIMASFATSWLKQVRKEVNHDTD